MKIDMEAGMKTLIVVTQVLFIDQILKYVSISKLPRKKAPVVKICDVALTVRFGT